MTSLGYARLQLFGAGSGDIIGFNVCQGMEVGELDVFSKAEAETIKRVLSSRKDRYRSPYGRIVEDHPRQCIFAGTTNNYEYFN